MIDLFNEYLNCFAHFVSLYFNSLEFIPGVSVGWLILGITLMGMTISFLYGRFKK